MSEWFYAKGGTQNGPVGFEHLQEMLRNGTLAETDLVWTSSMKDWQPAAQVEGLTVKPRDTVQPAPDPSNPYAAPQSLWNEPAPAAGSNMEEIAPGSEPIDVGACVKRGFELTKRNFGTILLVGLAYFVVTAVAAGLISMIIPMTGAGSPGSSGGSGAPGMAAVVVQQILTNLLSIFLSLGLVRIGLNFVSGKPVSVGQLFGEGGRMFQAIVASILFGIMVTLGFLLLIVPGIYLMLRYGQYMTAIVDKKMGALESLSYSSSITTNNRLNLLLLVFLSIAIVVAGLLALVVGLIFAYPVVWLSWMVAYRYMQYGSRAVQDHPGTATPLLSGIGNPA